MTIIQTKLEDTVAEIKTAVDQYNQLTEERNTLANKIAELQGALKVLKEVNEDQSSTAEVT